MSVGPLIFGQAGDDVGQGSCKVARRRVRKERKTKQKQSSCERHEKCLITQVFWCKDE